MSSPDPVTSAETPSLRDVLGREPWPPADDVTAPAVRGLSVAITGAAGSIGSALALEAARLGAGDLLLIDRRPMTRSPSARVLERDLADPAQTAALPLDGCDVVFHGAALKHLIPLERDPWSALENNTLATFDLIDRLRLTGARLVFVSTDKAADPASMLGSSKLLAEQAVAEAGGINVRLANVLGSAGSLVPRVRRAARLGRPVALRDPAATRLLLTIDETVTCLLEAARVGAPGDTLAPRGLRAVRVRDIVGWAAGPGKPPPVRMTRPGPGEKRHEALVSSLEDLSGVTPRLARVVREGEAPALDREELRHAVAARDGALASSILRRQIPGWEPSSPCAAAFRESRR